MTDEQKAQELREQIYNHPRIKTCAKCVHLFICSRTDSTNFGKDDRDFPEMLCKAEADSILSHILSEVEGIENNLVTEEHRWGFEMYRKAVLKLLGGK
jgi:hypothetical protein